MSNVESHRYKQRLDHLFKQSALLGDQAELQAHWARYLCILTAGFIEVSVRSILVEYAKGKSIPYIANFVSSQLKRFSNPNMEDILKLTGRFNPSWRDMLEKATTGEIKDAVDSIMANRNQIAHGTDSGITLVTINRHYNCVVKAIDTIEKIINNNP